MLSLCDQYSLTKTLRLVNSLFILTFFLCKTFVNEKHSYLPHSFFNPSTTQPVKSWTIPLKESAKPISDRKPAGNLFIITVDGFRWQEIFTGADEALINDVESTAGHCDHENAVLGRQ